MNTVARTFLAVVASLGIAVATAIGPVRAQPGPGYGGDVGMMEGYSGMMGGDWRQRWERMQQRHTQRMQELEKALNLKPEQQNAWKAFSEAHDAWVKSMHNNWQSWKGADNTPKRFEQMVAAAQDNLTDLRTMKDKVDALYQVLDPQQQATLDQFTAKPSRFKSKDQKK